MGARLSQIALICPTRTAFHIDSELETGLGGIEGANIALAKALASLGHEVVLYSRTDAERTSGTVRNVPISALDRPFTGADQYEVVISSNDARYLAFGGQAALKIMWFHNPLAIEKAIRRRQIIPMFRHRPIGVFVGAGLLQRTTSLFPLSRRIEIGLGVDDVFLTADVSAPRQNRFVYASQSHRGLFPLMGAWQRALDRLPADAELHVFGTDVDHAGMSAEQLETARIVFHGRVLKTSLVSAYASARAMLVPGAEDETFCLAAAEAQAMGVPVITMGIGSLAERVQHGVNGLICNSHGHMIAEACRLIEQSAVATKLSEGALALRASLGWPGVALAWQNLITGDHARLRSGQTDVV